MAPCVQFWGCLVRCNSVATVLLRYALCSYLVKYRSISVSWPAWSADELQAFLLPLGVGGTPDTAGARFLRDSFLKDLLLYGPRHIIWAITGSSMALVWISIAEAPPNGHVLIQHCRALDLPAVVSDAQLQLVWSQLVGIY